ncbi:phage holin family protein [Rosenbergiella australiborealis]|uniref:Inner membrane protein YqjE n=1 Tax=Rosenbergiella australiborealis TaxID=1544696 RepID=A0ABS5T531_9GAMM|nr:phage holin family protein [Rosenbergiella australiborealis]MBT0726088.1 hypothetical protein [Rosenbergiella australiborealis]
MSSSRPGSAPGQGILGVGQRILTTLVSIAETRIRLAIVELEEEKANLLQMLLMVGLTMIFTAFGLMSLMILVILAVPPSARLYAIIITTVVLFALAVIFGVWALVKSRRSTLLKHTRKELDTDRKQLEEKQA